LASLIGIKESALQLQKLKKRKKQWADTLLLKRIGVEYRDTFINID